MSGGSPFFAAAMNSDDVISQWKSFSATTRDGLIIFAALGLAILAALSWTLLFHKTRRRHHGHSRRWSPPASDASEPERHRKRIRKQRRPHRPRNPTLAETGGLPPVRQNGPDDMTF
jgi:hypothetical protein